VQPFLVDKRLSQQGYVTSEPYSIEKGGVRPVVFLLADLGYPPYAETVVVTRDTLAGRRDAVRRFVQASAEGWKSYLANPAPGNALIKRDNPQMEDDLIAFGVRKMKEYGIVTGGDAARLGIMTMTDERWRRTFEFMAEARIVKPGLDYRQAYTLDIVREVKVLP
jgi:NitT/TauT family transport system substrate-binding protein